MLLLFAYLVRHMRPESDSILHLAFIIENKLLKASKDMRRDNAGSPRCGGAKYTRPPISPDSFGRVQGWVGWL